MAYQRKVIILRTNCRLFKIPTIPRYWVKLTGIFEDENFPNEQTIAQRKMQKPHIAVNRRAAKVMTAVHDQKHCNNIL